jgi:hypothetical protein
MYRGSWANLATCDPYLTAGQAKMHLLPISVVSILEFCAEMDPALALLIMTRTGALHYRNACAHILYRLVSTAKGFWNMIRIPRLVSDAWICVQERGRYVTDRMIVEDVIRTGITVPGWSCPVWCFNKPEDGRWYLQLIEYYLPWCGLSPAVAESYMCCGWMPLNPDRPGHTATGRVLQEKNFMKSDLVLRIHEWDRTAAGVAEWVRTPCVGASLWQKAAVYSDSSWLQPVEDLSFRIRAGQKTRRPHPGALKELVAAGFKAPKHYITWAPQIETDLSDMLGPIFDRFSYSYITGSYPLFLMLGGPADLTSPCSMGWTAGGIDLYVLGKNRPHFPEEWGASIEIDGRETIKPPFLRGLVLYVTYPGDFVCTDLEVCDIALVRIKEGFVLGCSERSVLSLLTGVVRGWADVPIDAERAEKYADRGYEMRLGTESSAGARVLRFPEYVLDQSWNP